MSDTPPSDESSTVPPPPPPPGAEPPEDDDSFEGLRRSRSDRVIAGVAGGLGHYFGIDPVIVRVAFIVFTVFSGAGFLLYLLAWLIIAKEGRGESGAMRALSGSPEGNRGLLFVVLALGAVLILTSPLLWWGGFGFGDGLALPLLLIAAGVAFLIWPAERDHRAWHHREAARVNGEDDEDGEDVPPPPLGTAVRADLHEAADDVKAAGREVRSEFAEARDSFHQRRREWRHGYRGERARARAAGRGRSHRPPRPPKPAPFLGPLTMALLLVFAGVSIVGEQSDWWDVDPAVYGGIVLAVVGLALIASAFFGRARGLIVVGFVVLPAAWFLAAIDLEWHDGAGERVDTVASIDTLEDAYFFGYGEYQVDLSSVDFAGTDQTVEVGLTMGELTVWVPDTVTVEVAAHARAGEIQVAQPNGVSFGDDGFPADLDHRLEGSGDGRLTLEVDVGFGSINVRACTADTEQGDVRCP